MKKQSMMGSSEFELEPQKLEEKINARNEFIENSFNEIEKHINNLTSEYMRAGLGSYDSFRKAIVKKLVIKFQD